MSDEEDRKKRKEKAKEKRRKEEKKDEKKERKRRKTLTKSPREHQPDPLNAPIASGPSEAEKQRQRAASAAPSRTNDGRKTKRDELEIVFPKADEEKVDVSNSDTVMDQLRAMRSHETIYKQGWLWREEEVRSKWCKRWAVLTNHRMLFLKAPPQTPVANDPFPEVQLKTINSLKHGTEHGAGRKPHTFILQDDQNREIVLAACVDDSKVSPNTETIFDEYGSRAEWWEELKELIAKAKLRFVLIKQEGRTLLKDAAKKNMACIQAVNQLVDTTTVDAASGGFQQQAEVLEQRYSTLLHEVGKVVELDGNAAEKIQDAFTAVAEGVNVVVSLCPNRAVQEKIVTDMQEVGKDISALMSRSVDAHVNPRSLQEIQTIKSRVENRVSLTSRQVKDYGKFLRGMEEAVTSVTAEDLTDPLVVVATSEAASTVGKKDEESDADENGRKESVGLGLVAEERRTRRHREVEERRTHGTNRLVEDMKGLKDTAQALEAVLNSAHAVQSVAEVSDYAKNVGKLVLELSDVTAIVTASQGIDPSDPYAAALGNVREHQQHNLRALLSSAKGFSAAAANMMEMMKQKPHQEGDLAVQQRIQVATSSADQALRAFADACHNVQIEDYGDAQPSIASEEPGAKVHQALLQKEDDHVLNALEKAHLKLAASLKQLEGLDDIQYGATAKEMAEQADEMLQASMALNKDMMTADHDFHRVDHAWSEDVSASALSLASAVALVAEVLGKEDCKAEEIVAASRCLKAACARVVMVNAVKFDSSSAKMQQVQHAMRLISKLGAKLVMSGKAQVDEHQSTVADNRIDQIKLEFEAQARIARLEAELDQARGHLHRLRRSVYQRNL